MAFPDTTYTNGVTAFTALENKVAALGMTSAVLDQPSFIAAFLANYLDSPTLANNFAVTGTGTITSASAVALTVGRLGATTPAFTVDASTSSQVAGLKITGAATGGTVAIVATDSGSNTNVTLNAKGTGTIGIGTVSTGAVSITPILGATLKCMVSTTSGASLNLGNAGTAPSSPNNGDMWIESNTVKVRLNGATVTVQTA